MIGSNNRQTRFRILMVDRKVQTELKITDDKKEYNFHEISDVLIRNIIISFSINLVLIKF